MTKAAQDYWGRALESPEIAQDLFSKSTDICASRAYYAAFNAVTAWFLLQDQSFSKHSALRSGVHRELVRPGHWPTQLGSDYDFLMELRNLGDYGGSRHVSRKDAEVSMQAARRILQAVRKSNPGFFSDPKKILGGEA